MKTEYLGQTFLHVYVQITIERHILSIWKSLDIWQKIRHDLRRDLFYRTTLIYTYIFRIIIFSRSPDP